MRKFIVFVTLCLIAAFGGSALALDTNFREKRVFNSYSGRAAVAVASTLVSSSTTTSSSFAGYHRRQAQIFGDYTGTVVIRESLDNTNWYTVKDELGNAVSATKTTKGLFRWNSNAPWVSGTYSKLGVGNRPATVIIRATPNN